jgi:hypothetical protein
MAPPKAVPKIIAGFPAREAEIAAAAQQFPAADHLIKQRIAEVKKKLVDGLASDDGGDGDELTNALRYADATRALNEAPLVRDAQQRRLRRLRLELQEYRDSNLEHFHRDAVAATGEILSPIAAALVELDRAIADLPENLERINRQRPVPLDGVASGLNASLSGDLAALRDQLAAIEVVWPRDVRRDTGETINFAAERKRARQEAWERSAKIAAERRGGRAG